jgi:hypothetical protein
MYALELPALAMLFLASRIARSASRIAALVSRLAASLSARRAARDLGVGFLTDMSLPPCR